MPAFLGFCFNWILILVPTTRNPGTSLIPMGNDYKTFLGVPGSFFLHGWQCLFCSWAVPGGLWGHESGHVYYDAPITLFSNLTVPSPYIHAPNRIAGFHVKLVSRIFVWIPLPHAQAWSRHCECCLVCLAVLRRHWTQQVQKRRLLFAKNHALHPWTLSLCVYACARGSCVDSISLWVRKEAFSKPVFGVSKTSISGLVAVGPHCNRGWSSTQ